MKPLYLLAVLTALSCSKTIEDRCFIKEAEKNNYIEKKPYTAKQILDEKVNYLTITTLKKFRSFKQDSVYAHESKWRMYEKAKNTYDIDYKLFKDKFSEQFLCFGKQELGNTQYALGRNNLGYWLLKIENNQPSAYFLGLSFSHYYLNEIQAAPIIKDGFLQVEGSLVQIIKVPGLPGHDDYSALEDGKLFTISLKDLIKDSDHDGYNDIFEESFGLNPNNKDTDGDGTDDFNDQNPMFTSEKNKFSELYQMLLPTYATTLDFKKMPYYFEVFKSDCDYFHQINPTEYRVLFSPEDKNRQTGYIKITDVFDFGISKIKKDKKDPNTFYINKWGSGSFSDYTVEYKNGKWEVELVSQTVS
ncbi:hypothetical protein IW15_12720 [Chryseobacterium soli]|uniref:Lipoprotein n=1 Tax=Chryseobacterium soli TaxID=445961 RepID=A0A086A6U4_9FLAO|nr:hypothetical protein [Chryseobacterium soli]KFF12408.1 hypothetical protein IW15_12720 [Chryseobacterium soli]